MRQHNEIKLYFQVSFSLSLGPAETATTTTRTSEDNSFNKQNTGSARAL